LIKALLKTQKRYPDWYLIKTNTGSDHVHILIEVPPKYSISDVVQKLKAESASVLKKKFKFISKIYGDTGIWSTGYFVSTVGLNEVNIKKYIDRQNDFDRGIDLTGEFE
jgi:putative transposase